MSQVERVNAAWDRIEKWFSEKAPDMELGAGAGAADITALETHIGVALPEELKASLMRHNGVENWTKGELLSTGRIKNEWDWRSGLAEDEGYGERPGEDNEFIKNCWFDNSWIPIDADGGGNGACLDLNPGPKGTVGQILDLDHESGPSGPLFSDFAAYLEKAAEELEGGKFRMNEKGGYLEETD